MTTPRRSGRKHVSITFGHESCLFLLPFNETGAIHMDELDSESTRTTSKSLSTSSSAIRKFNKCMLTRSSNDELPVADTDARVNSSFVFTPGQFVFLHPTENISRPSVARVIDFRVSNGKSLVRINWFYRGEDLGDIIQNETSVIIPGEDEVFETSHYDNVDAETITGRCQVFSYPEWLKTHQRELSSKKTAENENAMDIEHSDDDDDTADIDDCDTDSTFSFNDNYSRASLYVYCRRFYDLQTQALLTSTFENKNANPLEELAKLRLDETAANQYDNDGDPTFTIAGQGDGNPSDSEEEAIISEDEKENLANRELYDEDEEFELSSVRKRKQSRNGRRGKRKPLGPRGKGARATFALPSYLGENLMCRDAQKAHVKNFLLGVIHDPCGKQGDLSRCLYISGVPGTGKTATVREVVRDLRVQRTKGELPPFQVLELNCMALPQPNAVYTELYAAVTGSRSVSAPHAAQLLEQRYMRNDLDDDYDDGMNGYGSASLDNGDEYGGRGGGRRGKGRGETKSKIKHNDSGQEGDGVIIVVLDEMDVLLARKQKVVYDLLEWPGRKNARIAMIGIANTMDLPERMLPRMGSRLGLNRLVYPPYNRDQLITILRQSHPSTQINDDALRLCASKVGGVSGDVRRALQLCRRALELTSDVPILPTHMQRAIHETAGDFRLCALAQLALLERITLACVVVVSRSLLSVEEEDSGVGALGGCSIGGVTERAWDVVVRFDSELQGFKPQHIDFEDACFRLANLRMVVIDKHLVRRLSRVILNVPVDDCSYALKDCSICKEILSEY